MSEVFPPVQQQKKTTKQTKAKQTKNPCRLFYVIELVNMIFDIACTLIYFQTIGYFSDVIGIRF